MDLEEGRSIFVTVGTTRFDELIKTIASEQFMKVHVISTHVDQCGPLVASHI